MSDTLTVLAPATEAALDTIPSAGAEDVDAAVARARAAFEGWRAIAPADCARLLRRISDAVAEHAEELAVLEARNAGKPIGAARGETGMVADVFGYAGAPERPLGDTIPVAGGQAFTVREPLGVVGLIVPWNFPLTIAAWKLGPALAAGNTVVLKPAELTPLSALRFAEIARDAGLPEVVPGLGPVAGARLVEHPGVAKIAFTGSTAVGSGIAAAAAGSLKRVTLKLGSKSPNVVFADADLEAAAAAAPGAVFGNAGQDCCARSRILVQRTASGVRPRCSVPSPRTPGPHGRRSSARSRSSSRSTTRPRRCGWTNDMIYGLSGSIWTRDGARALRVARALDAGALSINSNTSVRVTTPFGGFKQSGYGRELGPHALDAQTEEKSIFYSMEG